MFRKLAIPSILLLFSSPQVLAMGLGEIEMQSALNQPLEAVVNLTSVSGTALNEIKVSVASLDAFQHAGLDKPQFLDDLHFKIEQVSGGKTVVRITSFDPVREPYLEFLLELDWPKGHLLRQYTVLVDPPVTMPAMAPVTAPARSTAVVTTPAQPLAETPATQVTAAPVTAAVTESEPEPAAPAASEVGPIRRSDTLWSVAERVRPDKSVTIQQVMQALLRTNPDAFMGNNINRMKAGAVMKVPTLDEIRAMNAHAAAVESARQYQEWQEENSSGNKAAEPEKAAAPEQTPDKTAAKDTAETPAAAGTGQPAASRLTLVAPETNSVNTAAAPGDTVTPDAARPAESNTLQQQLTLATEDAAASRAQSAELQSRVKDLEQQVDTMKRLLELKNNALSQLQHQSARDEGAGSKPAGGQQPAEKAATGPATSVQNLLSWVMQNPLLTGGAALVVILLGILLRLAGKRNDPEGFDEMTLESRLSRQPDSHRQVPDIHVRETRSGEETVHSMGQDSDPLTEADVYIAYGRVQQAEELLRTALEQDPDNDVLRLKLLDVYHAAGNVPAFEEAASDFRDGVTEDDERWLKVATMGYSLAPDNTLFRAAAPAQPQAADVTGVEGLQDQETAMEPLPDSMEFSLDDYATAIEDEQEGTLTKEDEVSTKLDLARAYIDMDDRESARNILDEVMEEGNSTQKQEAERIIARLA